jgi:hypothetical protein
MALAANAVTELHYLLKRTLEKPASAVRDIAQAFVLGALSVYLVCVRCRGQLLAADPRLDTLLQAADQLPEYDDEKQAARCEAAAKIFTSMIQRDSFVRQAAMQHVRIPQQVMQACRFCPFWCNQYAGRSCKF